jgi:hypothetical protein
LAPSIFSATFANQDWPHYFISAFDETANQRNHDGYFLSELPHKPKDIAHAYQMLKPQIVKDAEKRGVQDIIRQGDIFAVPTNLSTRRLKNRATFYEKGSMEQHSYWGAVYQRLDYPRLLKTSHTATEVLVYRDNVYARGVIRHKPLTGGRPQHIDMSLGNVWHRIARNTALASYSTGGRVD